MLAMSWTYSYFCLQYSTDNGKKYPGLMGLLSNFKNELFSNVFDRCIRVLFARINYIFLLLINDKNSD